MPKLVFHIASDWEEVVRLRNEIAKLKQELKSMDSTQSPAAFQALNTQLSASTQRMDELVTNAAKAGAVMEGDFKKKIFEASQTVNGFTEKIIAQKNAVGSLQSTIRKNKELYKTIVSRGGEDKELLNHIREQEKALGKERDSLFRLTQQQAEARLSVKKLRDEYALYKDDAKDVAETNNGIAISWKKALAVIGGASVLKALGSEIIRVRGEFQAADTAIQTLLGSKEKADALMKQVREYAKISPLEFSDVTKATQMMLGFNIEAEKIPRYLQAIGDISMGETGKFNSLTLAFSQMSATGKLMGQDMNQMINAGFNPLQAIADKTGKSIEVLKDEMSKGAISAEMVQQAFIDATSAGGKFYNMSENASKTINGQISMMHDALDNVFNELGTKGEGVIIKGIQMTTSLIENYETVGKVLVGLITTYGAYRTALMLVTAAESKHTLVEIGLTNARILARKAQLALNASMLTNPYVLLATAVGGLITVNLTLIDTTRQLKAAEDSYNSSKDEAIRKEQEHKQEIENLLSVASNEKAATDDRKEALVKLIQKYPSVFEKYKTETEMLQHILDIKREIAALENNNSVSNPKNELNDVNNQIADLEKLAKQRYHGGRGLTNAENAKLEMLKNRRSDLEGTLKKKETDAILADLTGYSNTQIEAAIKARERLLAKMQLKGTDKGTITGNNILSGTFTKEELEGQKKLLQAALAKPSTYKEDYEKAKKEWEDAKKKLSEIEKDKSKFTSKQYEEAKKREETAEKAYKKLGGVTGGKLTKEENQAEKLRKQQEKYKSLLDKQSLEQKRSAEDLQMKVDEARIKAMDEGSAKTIAEMELNFEKEMQAVDRQKEDALRKKIENAHSAWEANPENKGKSFDATGIELSDDERKYYDELYKLTIANNEKSYSELANQYLSYTDQRLAIEKKFNDDVAILQEARKKAEERGDVNEVAKIDRSIEKRTEIKNEDVFKLDAEEFKKSMNWEQVFGDLDKVSTDTLKKLKANLKDFISAQKDLSPENLKELVDAIERIDDKVSERNPFEAMSTSFKSLKDATDEEHEAQKAYNKALKEGTDEEKKNAKATLESAKNNKQRALSEATTALHKGVDEIGQYVDAGNQVIGIMETLGVKTPEWLGGYMEGMGEMLNGLSNIDLTKPMSIVTGSLQTIKGALSSITSLGGIINWNGSNAKEVQDSINRLTDRNEALQTSIESLTDEIKASKGMKSVDAYEEAVKYQQETNDNYKRIAQEQASYHHSHRSWNYYWGGFSQEQTNRFSKKIGREWDGDIWNLSPEEMKMLRETIDMWETIQKSGKGGYGGRLTDKLNDYIDQAGKLEELMDNLYEGLTGMTFDSMYDSFVSSLMDMEKSAEDVADDISKYFMQAMLSNAIGEQFSDKLKAWYDKFGESMRNDGTLDEKELGDLKDEYMKYVEEAMKLRDELAAATGYDKIANESSSQSSTSRGFGTEMTHEDAGELSGRFTALQATGEEIKNQVIIQTQSLTLLTAKADTILSVNTETRNIADETRDLIAQSYLELVQISENTGAIVKPIQQMQKDIAEVKKNTSRL